MAMTLQDIITAMFGGQTAGTQQAQAQMPPKNQAMLGQIVPPTGAIANMLAGLGALHPDQPKYMGGQQVLGGTAMPFRARGQALEYLEKTSPTQMWKELEQPSKGEPGGPADPEIIKANAKDHGVETGYINGRLHVKDKGVDPNGKPFESWQDTTHWTSQELKKWLGY